MAMKLLTILAVTSILLSGANAEIVIKWDRVSDAVEGIARTVAPFFYIGYYYQSDETITQTLGSMCDINETEILEKFHNLKSCNNEGDWEKSTLCNYFENRFEFCFEPLGEQIEECLKEEQKFLPGFFLNTSLSLTSQFCKSQGETFMEFAHPCLDYSTFFNECYKELKPLLKDMAHTGDITKPKLCHMEKVLRTCASTLTANCKSPGTANNLRGWLNALTKQCDNTKS